MLRGKKVVLRDKELEDANDDYTWRSDEELSRLDAAPTLRIPFTHFLVSYTEEMRRTSPRRRRFAIDTLDGKHIGNCMYYNVDRRKLEAEMGVMIGDRDCWGQGYGSDAVNTLLGYLFNTLEMERVYLNTLEWNARAQRCFEKCGMVACRRRRRLNGTFVVMEIHRSAYSSEGPAIDKGQEG